MSSDDDERLPTSSKSKDDDKSYFKSEIQIKIGEHGEKIYYSQDSQGKRSMTRVNDPTNSTCNNPNECDESNCDLMIKIEGPKIPKKRMDDNSDDMRIILRNPTFTKKKCFHCPNGKLMRLRSRRLPTMSGIRRYPTISYRSYVNAFDDDFISITESVLNKLDEAMKLESELIQISNSLFDNEDSQLSYQGPENNSLIRIEDGRLFYEDVWYRSGQHIYLKGDLLVKFTAVICGISKDSIWVLKTSDNSKFRFHIDHLIYGEILIARRFPAIYL